MGGHISIHSLIGIENTANRIAKAIGHPSIIPRAGDYPKTHTTLKIIQESIFVSHKAQANHNRQLVSLLQNIKTFACRHAGKHPFTQSKIDVTYTGLKNWAAVNTNIDSR